jgi:hypothetical protein
MSLQCSLPPAFAPLALDITGDHARATSRDMILMPLAEGSRGRKVKSKQTCLMRNMQIQTCPDDLASGAAAVALLVSFFVSVDLFLSRAVE